MEASTKCRHQTIKADLAVDALRKYGEITEAQMEEVHRCERISLEAKRRGDGDEEANGLFTNDERYLEDEFEQELIPMMRYSFVILIHTVFETRLRKFCDELQTERQYPITLKDLSGSPLDKARTYLTKVVGISVENCSEWQQLRTFQNVRDCIAHAYGYVSELKRDDQKKELRKLAETDGNISIVNNRLILTKAFCDGHLECLSRLMQILFRAVGWKP